MSDSPHERRSAALLLTATLCLVAGCSDTGPSPDPEPVGGPVPTSSSLRQAQEEESEEATGETVGEGDFTNVVVEETIAADLRAPWDVAFGPDGLVLVTLRDSGEVLRLDDERGVTVLDAGGPGGAVPDVHHESEDGLLGVAIGPDDGVYLYLTTPSDNRVVRMDLEGDALVDPVVLLDGIPSNPNHNGGRIAFGPDGYLYVATGDARQTSLAQDTDSLAGKILRITTGGEPAPGNPFGNEVWSYGHRNVQGLGWTSDGRMYASEFGTSEFDELNLIEPGANYGWPHIEGWAGEAEYVDPLVTWSTAEASPSGIAVTDAGVWLAGLRGERLWYVPFDGDGPGEPRAYLDVGRLRTVAVTPEGDLWVITSNTDGRGDPRDDDDRILQIATD